MAMPSTVIRLFLLAQDAEIVLGVLIEVLGLNRVSPRGSVARHGDIAFISAARIGGCLTRVARFGRPARVA